MGQDYTDIDSRLARKAAKGDKEAFTKLWLKHRGNVTAQAYRMARSWQVAAEVAHMVSISAWRARASFRGDAKYSTWLYSICRNEFRMWLRRKTICMEDTVSDVEWEILTNQTPDVSTPEKQVATEQVLKALQVRVERLPQEAKVIFLARYVEKMRAKDLAAAQGLTVPAVKSRIHRNRPKCERLIASTVRAING